MWRFHRVLTARWRAQRGINLSGNPTPSRWLIQGNIRGCVLNACTRVVEAHAWIRRECGGIYLEGRKNQDVSRRLLPRFFLPSFLSTWLDRSTSISLFPPLPFSFVFIRCNPIQRTDFLPFFVFHRAELFYRPAITISLVVETKERRGTATNAQSNYTPMPV